MQVLVLSIAAANTLLALQPAQRSDHIADALAVHITIGSPLPGRPGRRSLSRSAPRWRALAGLAGLVGIVASTAGLVPASISDAQTPVRVSPHVTRLSAGNGGTWGGDLITITGSGFDGSGSRGVHTVRFGKYEADGFEVLNATTIQAWTPEVIDERAAVHVDVVLRDATVSSHTKADIFTFVIPSSSTPINGHWNAAQARAVAGSMLPRAGALEAEAVAPSPGRWTPAMGASAVRRAAGWLGMPYSWAGGTYTGPTAGSCSGGGRVASFDCTIPGFDCSGLTLYAWGKYEHLAHFAATQLGQAGSFHPTLDELQPGDLMFFSGGGPVVSHVVMYAGGGRVIQASESGWPVRYTPLADVLSYEARYFGATRPMSLNAESLPTVTSVSVSHSATGGGGSVTLRGTHLDTAAMVYFGATGSSDFAHSSSSITVTIPAHAAGAINVRVYNAWGESPASPRAVLTYVAKPTVKTVSPSSATPAGLGTVVITGADFYPGAHVYFGTRAAAGVRVVSPTRITMVAPSHAAGTVVVWVTTAYGASNRTNFTYRAPRESPPPAPPAPPAPSAPSAPSAPPLTSAPPVPAVPTVPTAPPVPPVPPAPSSSESATAPAP